jgi:peptidoglycan hydrolase-like protein with peptidoglycan-binding domain
MPNFGDENTDPTVSPAGARARVLLAAGAGIAAGASLAAAQAGTAAASAGTSSLGIAAHKRSSHHSAARHHSTPVPSPELLAVGDRGAAVSQVQRALHRHATGYFGSGTRQAVAHYQHRHHLIEDGVVGPHTRRALHLRVRIVGGVPAAPTQAPAPAATTATTSASSSSTQPAATQSTGSGGYSIPSSIVQCESGGNWHAVNSSSGAGGAYQIMPSTWRAYGGTGLPQDASPTQQSAIASKIWAANGPSAWSCG